MDRVLQRNPSPFRAQDELPLGSSSEQNQTSRHVRSNGALHYSYTNHKKHLPIDGLGGACCSNQKTILRRGIEDHVPSCLAPAFFGMGVFDDVARQVRQNLASAIRTEPDHDSVLPTN